jgi:hypothetical protein
LVDSWTVSIRKRVLLGAGLVMTGGFLLLSMFANDASFLLPVKAFFGVMPELSTEDNLLALARYQFVLYTSGYFIVSVSMCLQDAILDPMGRHLVSRYRSNGNLYSMEALRKRVGLLQTWCRISFASASLVGTIAGGILMYVQVPMGTIFLLGLITPIVVICSLAILDLPEEIPATPMSKKIVSLALLLLGVSVLAQLVDVPGASEAVFVISLGAIIALLSILYKKSTLPAATLRGMLFTAVTFFLIGMTPGVGDGVSWWQRAELGYDRSFETALSVGSLLISMVIVFFAYHLTLSGHLGKLLLVFTAILSCSGLITIGFWYGMHVMIGNFFGVEPLQMVRYIAWIDTAASSPFIMLYGMLMFIFIAQYAEREGTATWMTIFASFFNLGSTASSLFTEYLNMLFPVSRTDFAHLGELLWASWGINLIFPVLVVLLLLTPGRPASVPLGYMLWRKIKG